MSDHDALRADLSGLAAEALPTADAARLDEHLAGCAGCRAELEELRGTMAILNPGAVPEVDLDLDLRGFYEDRIAPFVEPRRTSLWRKFGGLLLSIAALALAFTAGFYVSRNLPRVETPIIEARKGSGEEHLAQAWRASAEGESGLSRAVLALSALERRRR